MTTSGDVSDCWDGTYQQTDCFGHHSAILGLEPFATFRTIPRAAIAERGRRPRGRRRWIETGALGDDPPPPRRPGHDGSRAGDRPRRVRTPREPGREALAQICISKREVPAGSHGRYDLCQRPTCATTTSRAGSASCHRCCTLRRRGPSRRWFGHRSREGGPHGRSDLRRCSP